MKGIAVNSIIRLAAVVATLTVLVIASGCGPSDPAREVLETRRHWKVDLMGFVQQEDGAVSAQFRLSGPVYSKLADLTVRCDLLDAEDRIISTHWNSFDLREVRRGGPVERFLTVRPPDGSLAVESIRLDPVHYPEPGDYAHIPELDGLGPPAD